MTQRTFKSAWFAKAARKAKIADAELCEAVAEILLGQADDLGGGVFKKRLNKNMHRSIVLTNSGTLWIYQYLFAKKDRDNIRDDELAAFKQLAKGYDRLDPTALGALVEGGDLVEICHDGT